MDKIENVKFLLERLYVSTEIPYHVYDSDGSLMLQAGNEPVQNDLNYTDKNLWHTMKEKSEGKHTPLLHVEEDIFVYGIFLDEESNYYIFGPIALAVPSVSQMHYYRERHGTQKETYLIPIKSYIVLANLLSLAFWGVTSRQVTEDVILTTIDERSVDNQIESKDLDKYQFEKSEYDIQHLSYQFEQNYLTAVENGDVEFFKESHTEEPKAMDKIGKLADNSSKQMEYMCVASIILVGRAAMNGGLNPARAYALSDLYLQKLEKCKSVQEMIRLHQLMRTDFVTRVKAEKERNVHNGYIEKCKNYIAQRVHYSIKISEIADFIGVNHSYLSRKFSEQEGITIAQYNIKVRIRAAANMLKYSEASIAEVSDYFCFASQSRFGNNFKSEYGVTPSVYRKENQVIDFSAASQK